MKYNHIKHPSRLVTLMATFGGGSRVEEDKYPRGIAHFMEHMRFRGNDEYTAKDLLKKVAYHGGSWNAFTSHDLVNFYIKMPVENIDMAFKYLSEIIFNPGFPEAEIEKEKEVVCQEIRMYEDDVNDLTYNTMMRNIFNNALQHKIAGTEESVRSITRQDLLRFNDEFYNRGNMLVTLVSPESRDDLVAKYFGEADGVVNFKQPSTDVEYYPSSLREFEKSGHIQNTIMLGFGSPELHKDIKKNLHVAKVFNAIFGGADDSRLFLNVRETQGLVYGIGADVDDMFDGTTYLISTITEPENTEKVLTAIDQEITEICSNGVTQEELTRAKNRIKSYLYASLESSHGNAMRGILQEFAKYDTIEVFLEKIDSVTSEQVNAFAKTLFATNKYVVVCKGVGDKGAANN